MTDFPVMSGNANMAVGASYFEVPLFSHIVDNLWIGCSPSEFPEGDSWLVENGKPRFNIIFNLFPWGEYYSPKGTVECVYMLYDGEDEPGDLDEIAEAVTSALMGGLKVLVHCQAGLNRSSLVAGRALMVWKHLTADEAIKLIREKRSPMCLCNPHFEAMLRRFDGTDESEEG